MALAALRYDERSLTVWVSAWTSSLRKDEIVRADVCAIAPLTLSRHAVLAPCKTVSVTVLSCTALVARTWHLARARVLATEPQSATFRAQGAWQRRLPRRLSAVLDLQMLPRHCSGIGAFFLTPNTITSSL